MNVEAPLYILKVVTESQIPVCLAGRGNFTIKDNDTIHDIDVIINALPLKNETKLFLAVESCNEKYLNIYISKYQQTALPGINMIESWMVRGSDHWFIKPSTWDDIAESRKQQILKDILDVKLNIGTPYNYSIFNSLRKKIIEDYMGVTSTIDEEIKKKIDIELRKL
jgi:hypothetical protein